MDALAEFERTFAGHPWLAMVIDGNTTILAANRAADGLGQPAGAESPRLIDCTECGKDALREAVAGALAGRSSLLTISTTDPAKKELEATVSPWDGKGV